jgi:hypothetical protein
MDSHRLRADAIGAHQVAHGLTIFPSTTSTEAISMLLKTAGFGIDYAQHAMLLTQND